MDLNKTSVTFSHNCETTMKENFGDTALYLNSLCYGGGKHDRNASDQSNHQREFSTSSDDSCQLVLGLGPTPSAYRHDYLSAGNNKSKGLAQIFLQGVSAEGKSILKLGLYGVNKDATSGVNCSLLTKSDTSLPLVNQASANGNRLLISVVDEGSKSTKTSGGYMPSLLLAPRMEVGELSIQTQENLDSGVNSQTYQSQVSHEQSASTEFSVGSVSEQSTTGTSLERRNNSQRKCKFAACTKGARGATGFCIAHGGGQRCQRPGCNKGAESRTAYCKSHGGGRRCHELGCTKSAEGKTDFCIAHGGGRRCGFPGGCTKAARGKSGLCIRHGGGKRCKVEGCTRSAEGQAGFCISHGGGRRCQLTGCSKGAQGSTMFCKAHGGGKRCIFSGCTKGAEGSTPLCKGHGGGKRCLFDGGGICPKSVHGGTNFCVAHGGGKRCVVSGCTKSARGRTDSCVRHGGGKRCKFEQCGKSAQGSTDFCKAHGGGKRCAWGDGKCEKFARGKNGLCAAHSTMVQEMENKGSLISPVLFHGLISAASTGMDKENNNNSSSGVSVVSDYMESGAKRQHLLIPQQVLVPLSMKSSSYPGLVSAEKQDEDRNGHGRFDYVVPEGRVHGGGLMSLFGGNLNNAMDRMSS